jgi:heme exporter protein CcmD
MNFHDLFAMGNYGVYVWTAYACTIVVFGINILVGYRESRAVKKIIRHYVLSQNTSNVS